MDAKTFAEILGADFYAGVPDSQLRSPPDIILRPGGRPSSHALQGKITLELLDVLGIALMKPARKIWIIDGDGVGMVEIKCAIGARSDLGRPTTTPLENKNKFMAALVR